MSSVRSVLKLYNKDHLPLRDNFETAELEERVIGVRSPTACEDVSPGEEERPLLEDVTKQRSEDCG
jgi:hypothetical protein